MAYTWTSTIKIRRVLGVNSTVFTDAELDQFGEAAEDEVKADGILWGEATMDAAADTYNMLTHASTWMAVSLIGSRMIADQQRFGAVSIGGISVSAPNFQYAIGQWRAHSNEFMDKWATLKGHKTYPKSITQEWTPTYVKT